MVKISTLKEAFQPSAMIKVFLKNVSKIHSNNFEQKLREKIQKKYLGVCFKGHMGNNWILITFTRFQL